MRKGRQPTTAQTAWRRSKRLREIGAATLSAYNADRLSKTRCGAKRKRDGEPCEAAPMENGRCRLHGGATPKGDQWHKLQLPTKDRPGALEKWERKRRDHERARKKREQRLAAMSAEERAKHDAWQRSHRPGSPHERAQRRADRKLALEWGKPIAARAVPISAEAADRRRMIDVADRLIRGSETLGVDP